MTKLLKSGARILLAAIASTLATSPCRADDQRVVAERIEVPLSGACDDYPIALYPDPDAQAQAEADLQNLAGGGAMVWHPARGTFWFVTLSVPLPQCGPQTDVFTQLFALTSAYPNLFQLDLTEWKPPASYPCSNIGQVAQVLEIQRARIGSHPISHDLMKFTVQRVSGIVTLQALYGEYLPPATPWLDQALAACPSLDEVLARQVVLDSQFAYTVFRNCGYMGTGLYSPDALDAIQFRPVPGRWTWHEDPTNTHVLFTKSSQGSLVLNPSNYTRELIRSDANCPNRLGQPVIGFGLTFDTVETELVGYKPGLDCVVCLR